MDPSELLELMPGWIDGAGPLYRRLAGSIADRIHDGSLRSGDRLPPERALANHLAVSRGTVVKAYDELTSNKLTERRQGSGTTVTGAALDHAATSERSVGDRLWLPEGEAIDLLKAIPAVLPEVLDLLHDVDLRTFGDALDTAEPLGWWTLRTKIAAVGRHSSGQTPSGTSAREGSPHHVSLRPVSPHQIMVTSGAQQAISLIVQSFVRPGDVVLGEAYTWPGLIDPVEALGARFQPVAMDAHGVIVDDLVRQVRRFRPALVALNPQHQNPTGARLPLDRVEAIARLAHQERVLVAEDRVAADLAFDRYRTPRIADFDQDGHVITVGSICKLAWPGVRVGWIEADAQLINTLRSTKATSDMFTSLVSQAAALAVLDNLDDLAELRIDQLRSRRDVLVEALAERLPDWQFSPPRGGLSLWLTLPDGASADAFARHAAQSGVLVASGREFSVERRDTSYIRIPFTAEPDTLRTGVSRLADAWGSFEPSRDGAAFEVM